MPRAAAVTPRALTFASLFIVAVPSWSVTRVVDGDANAVSGAQVIVTFAQGSQPSALPAARVSGTSDDKGHLPFGIPAIRGATVIIDHRAFAPVAFDTEQRVNAGDIRLGRGQTWRGEIVARSAARESLSGEICAHGQIGANSPAANPYRWSRCANVERGSFEIEGLPSGLLDVDLQIAGYLPRVESVDPLKTRTLRVERGLLLRGVVTDARGLPVAGAKVSAGRARSASDKEGRLSVAVDSLPAGVEVRMRGFRPWKSDIRRAGEFRVRLDPSATISGVLVSDDGGSLRDVAIELVRTRDDGGHSALWSPLEIGKEGAFVVDVPDAGRYAIAFHATGYREARFADLQVGYGAALPLGVVSVSRGGGIHASVIDRTEGKGVAGAFIELVPAGALLLRMVGQYSRPAFVSGEDGQFTAAGYEIGRYLVSIRRGESAAVHRLVDLERDEIVNLGTISLDRGVEIRGRVAAVDREAARNVPVHLFDAAREMLTPLATTMSEDGKFNFSRVSPDRYRIEVGGERLLLSQEIIIRGNEPVISLTLLAAGIRLRGHVTSGGIPVSGGTVRLVSELDPARRRGKIVTRRGGETLGWGLPQSSFATSVEADGRFILDGAPAGLVRLWYVGPSGETVLRSVVLSDESEQRVDLELNGDVLEGRLIDAATGAPVTGTVRLFDADGRSLTEVAAAADGTFHVSDLERSVYTIDARAVGYLPAAAKNVFVGKESSPVILELERGEPGKIAVILTRTDGMGVNGVPVTLFDERGALAKSLPTDDSGRRAFDDVSPGKYIVGWSDPLAGAGSSSSVQIDASHTPSLPVTLQRGASITLRCSVHQCSGAPISLLEVYSAAGLEMSPLLSGITPALRLSTDGEVSIGRLAPGRYRFRLWIGDRQWENDVTIGSSDQTVVFQ